MSAECLTLLTDFAEGMHDPSTELTEVFVESKHGSGESKERGGINEDRRAERMGGQAQGFSCK